MNDDEIQADAESEAMKTRTKVNTMFSIIDGKKAYAWDLNVRLKDLASVALVYVRIFENVSFMVLNGFSHIFSNYYWSDVIRSFSIQKMRRKRYMKYVCKHFTAVQFFLCGESSL